MTQEFDYWHVTPTNDVFEHDTEHQGMCWCNPKIEKQENGNYVVTHNSMDGREYQEVDNEKYGKTN